MTEPRGWDPHTQVIFTGRDLRQAIGALTELADAAQAGAARLGAPGPDLDSEHGGNLFGIFTAWADRIDRWNAAAADARRAEVARDHRAALRRLAGKPGLAWTRLFPGGGTYLVAYDGTEIGAVSAGRTRHQAGKTTHDDWTATAAGDPLAKFGPYRGLKQAAGSLIGPARAAGRLASF